jgi:hypothetical protein
VDNDIELAIKKLKELGYPDLAEAVIRLLNDYYACADHSDVWV